MIHHLAHLSILIAPWLTSAEAVTPEPPTLLQAVPEGSMIVMTIDRLDDIRERASRSSWVQFFQDEQFASAFEAFSEASVLEEVLTSSGSWPEEFDAGAFLASIHGGVVFFLDVHGDPGDEGDATGGFLFEPGGPDETFALNLERVIEVIEQDEETYLDEYQGVNLWGAEGVDGSEDVNLLFFVADDLVGLMIASSPELVREQVFAAIDRYRGDDPSLGFADPAILPARREADAPRPAFKLLVDLQAFIEVLALGEGEFDEEDMEMISAIGLDRVGWLQLEADIGAGEALSLSFQTQIPSDTMLGGFADQLGVLPVGMLSEMPAESTSVGFFDYDLWGAYGVARDLLAKTTPEAVEEIDAGFAEGSEALGLDLEAALRQITGRFGSFQLQVNPEEAFSADELDVIEELDPALAQGQAFLIELEEVGPVRDLVSAAVKMSGFEAMIETEEFQGTTIQVLPFGPPHYQWALTSDYLVISEGPTPLRSHLRLIGGGDVPSAASDESFVSATRELGDVAGGSISTSRFLARQALAVGQMIPMLLGMAGSDLASGEDDPFARVGSALLSAEWPDPDLASEYFEGTITSSVYRRGETLGIQLIGR
jgi:hypothetical protein